MESKSDQLKAEFAKLQAETRAVELETRQILADVEELGQEEAAATDVRRQTRKLEIAKENLERTRKAVGSAPAPAVSPEPIQPATPPAPAPKPAPKPADKTEKDS